MEIKLIAGVVFVQGIEICDVVAVGVGVGEGELGLLLFATEVMLENDLELAGLPHDQG